MVAHTSKVTEIMSDRCAGVCNELIVHFILYFIHGQTYDKDRESTRENHHCEKHGNTQISPNLSHKL
jgi:hypothetical protein